MNAKIESKEIKNVELIKKEKKTCSMKLCISIFKFTLI